VIPEVDAGEVILSKTIDIQHNDTFDLLKARIQTEEKPVLIRAINISLLNIKYKKIHQGKVCNISMVDENTLAFEYSDRASCFDKIVCDIPGKGLQLATQSAWCVFIQSS